MSERPGVRQDPSFEVLGREERFRGRIVAVRQDHVRLPGGVEVRHEVIELPSAVAVVPVLEGRGGRLEVILIEQFRTALQGFIHEVPAGILEPGEDPAACAARELEEETGYGAARVTHLATLFPIPGTSAHEMHFYLAEGLRPGAQRLEAGECLTVKKFELDRLLAGLGAADPAVPPAAAPVLTDAKTRIGILHAALRLGRLGPR